MSSHEENVKKFYDSAGFSKPADLGIQFVGVPLNLDKKSVTEVIEATKALMLSNIKPERTYVPPDRKAPEGQIWECQACGKRSPDLYDGPGMWDESCSLNATLVDL